MAEQITNASEIQRQKVPWAMVVILAIGASLAGQVAITFSGGLGNMKAFYIWGIQGGGLGFAFLSYGLLILTYPIARLFKRRMSPIMLTYIFTIGTMTSYVIGHGWAEQYPVLMAEYRVYDIENVLVGWWQVPQNLAEQLIAGNVAMDWGAWSSPIFFWMAQFVIFYMLSSAITIIFRHQWMDVEVIPFPLVIAGHDILTVVGNEGGKRDLRPFIIGILLGLGFELPVFLQGVFPWFPDLYGYRANTCCSGTWCLPLDNAFSSSIVGLTHIIKNPLYYAIFYLSPLSVAFNAWFWSFVVWALLQVAYYMGYYTGMLSTGGACRQLWGGPNSTFIAPPFGWDYVSGVGGILGIVIFSLYNRRAYLLETLRAASGKASKLSETEKTEPMTYRMAYIMFIVGCILMTLLLVSAGIDFAAALMLIFPTALTTYFAGVLVWGYTGCNIAWSWAARSPWALHTLWPQVPESYSTNWVMSHFLAFIPGTNFQGWEKGLFGTAQSFKMAKFTNTNTKDVFLVATVTLILGLITANVTSVWLYNIFGSSRLGTARCNIIKYCAGSIENIGAMPSLPEMYSYAAVGFIVTGVLSLLHARYVWFPFEPIGFVIATSQSLQQLGVWSAFLFAWAAKTIVLKTGGSKLYERSIGVVGGYIAGAVIVCFIASIMGDIRFFYPF